MEALTRTEFLKQKVKQKEMMSIRDENEMRALIADINHKLKNSDGQDVLVYSGSDLRSSMLAKIEEQYCHWATTVMRIPPPCLGYESTQVIYMTLKPYEDEVMAKKRHDALDNDHW